MPPNPYTTGPAGNWCNSADAQITHNCAHSLQAITRTSNTPIGGSARVFLYERRSRAVVTGDAFRSRSEAGLAAWGSLDVRDGHLQAPRPSAGT